MLCLALEGNCVTVAVISAVVGIVLGIINATSALGKKGKMGLKDDIVFLLWVASAALVHFTWNQDLFLAGVSLTTLQTDAFYAAAYSYLFIGGVVYVVTFLPIPILLYKGIKAKV